VIAAANTPLWVNSVIVVGVICTTVTAVWRLVLSPISKLIALGADLRPILIELRDEMGATEEPFAVLDEIVAQFRTDSGSSLRDVINRVEAALTGATVQITSVQASADSAKMQADADRQRVAQVTIQVEELTAWRRTSQAEKPANARLAARTAEDVLAEAKVQAAKILADAETVASTLAATQPSAP
jgi:hypothetical protein